ncbi:uncharacterized protein N7496_010568 [Penicillium cataractarum]|uniref:Methyltransferase FkbM domain-containing protein n=1 Tax=Penicillium cataractarum TaxID=2100454 RepID=A0A9W9V382_9EURO|nr:uncharacterized protein N7496_010568 [Penicillium cataractarum]KAJ5364855.1 hypothetical protein N7496_010568 [Penicillium cataractarum]
MPMHRIFIVLTGNIIFVTLILVASRSSYYGSRLGHTQVTQRPRYIFIDIGANRADTLEVFLKQKSAKFEYDFPRPDWATYDQAGEHAQSNLKSYGSVNILTKLKSSLELEIHLFEANPHFNAALLHAKERHVELGVQVEIYPSTVADIKDGTRIFYLDTVNTAHDFWGSSIYASHPDVVRSKNNGTELSTVNLSRWLLMNTLPRDFVVVKMDVEGSEYELVPHMAEMGVSAVLDYLLVEWHPSVIDKADLPEDEVTFRHARMKAAEEKLKAEGVNMPHYDSSA